MSLSGLIGALPFGGFGGKGLSGGVHTGFRKSKLGKGLEKAGWGGILGGLGTAGVLYSLYNKNKDKGFDSDMGWQGPETEPGFYEGESYDPTMEPDEGDSMERPYDLSLLSHFFSNKGGPVDSDLSPNNDEIPWGGQHQQPLGGMDDYPRMSDYSDRSGGGRY